MASVSFRIESKENKLVPIYVRLSVSRDINPKAKSGFYIYPKDWKNGTPIQNNPENKNLKKNLLNFNSFIIDEVHNEKILKSINTSWLKNKISKYHHVPENVDTDLMVKYAENVFIEDLNEQFDNNISNVKKDTISKYQNLINKIKGFQVLKKQEYYIRDINLKFRNEFYIYLTSNLVKMNKNTAGRMLGILKTILNHAQKKGKEVSPEIREIKTSKVKALFTTLSFNEIEQIKKTELSDKRLQIAKDWLIIGCYTGQRVSDLLRMDKSMITKIKNFDFIIITQKKTGKTVQIPLHKEVSDVLKKWDGNFPDLYTLNISSNAAMLNEHIKEVCKIAGINELTRGTLKDENGISTTGMYEKFKLISTHSFRRSFCSNYYGMEDYTTPILMNISGHSSEKMFLSYIDRQPIDFALNLANIWEKKKLI